MLIIAELFFALDGNQRLQMDVHLGPFYSKRYTPSVGMGHLHRGVDPL